MKKIYLNIVTLIFLILFSCEKKQAINTNAFQNRWESMDGNLTIYSNNTFEYNRYTCISHSISKGKWKLTNDTLVLNSFEPKGCYFIENFLIGPPPKDTSINHKKTIKDCMPNTGYINLKNEKFYIKDSILIFKTHLNNKELNNFYNFKRIPYKKIND